MKTEESVYKSIIPLIKELAEEDLPVISVLSNTAAVLFSSFEKISWAGFYLIKNNILYLGPFQGKPACTRIDLNRGVCGKSAREMKTVIVEDVELFPGHIACDSASRSEIVVPVIAYEKTAAVLDIDSCSYSSFGETDKKYLEKIISIITQNTDISSLSI